MSKDCDKDEINEPTARRRKNSKLRNTVRMNKSEKRNSKTALVMRWKKVRRAQKKKHTTSDSAKLLAQDIRAREGDEETSKVESWIEAIDHPIMLQ